MNRHIPQVCVALLVAAGLSCAKRHEKLGVPTEKATRGDFLLQIRERCEIQAENARKIVCPRFRRWMPLKIIKLVPEGSEVKKGDFLMSLDKTELKRIERDRKADVRRAKAEVERLQKSLTIERDKLTSEVDRRKADLRIKELNFAHLQDLPTSVTATEAEVELQKAKMDAVFANEEFEPVKVLAKMGFESQAQFSEKKLAADQAAIEQEARQLSYRQTMAGAEKLDLQQAKLDLREAQLRCARAACDLELKVRRAQKALEAAEWDLKREELELRRFQESLKLAEFLAPKAGVVVYQKVFQGTAKEKIKEGVSVRPRRHLMSIEDMSTMIAEVQVEEAQISMVKLKQRAEVTLDAVQDRTFTGQVIEVGAIAREKGEKDSGSWWKGKASKEDSGIRVFDVKIRLDGCDPRLRSGMAGPVQITVARIPDAVSIPVTAVFRRVDRTSYVYVLEGGKAVKRTVTTGRSADGRVVVTKGLAEREVVCLSEPEASQ